MEKLCHDISYMYAFVMCVKPSIKTECQAFFLIYYNNFLDIINISYRITFTCFLQHPPTHHPNTHTWFLPDTLLLLLLLARVVYSRYLHETKYTHL